VVDRVWQPSAGRRATPDAAQEKDVGCTDRDYRTLSDEIPHWADNRSLFGNRCSRGSLDILNNPL